MYQLVKSMLTIGAGLPPDDGASVVVNVFAVNRNGFAITFHITLLKVISKKYRD